MENKPKRPNLFDLATKELSQDGFFAWLLSWANPDCENFDPQLHQAGQDFVRFLLEKLDKPYDRAIETVKVKLQWKSIDIGVKINDDLFIIIEDKTNTKQHDDQLNRYRTIAENYYNGEGKREKRQIVCIYLKSGNESKASLKKVTDQAYRIVDRPDLISFFDRHQQIDNAIYTDFVARMRRLENAAQSYLTKPIGKWTRGSWEGFYMFLEEDEHLKVKNWDYVSNPTGGFVGLWWHFVKKEDQFTAYLQIEQGNLCFRVRDIKENQSKMRDKLSKSLIKMAKEELQIDKPKHLGKGAAMTIAVVKREDWLGKDDEMFDPSEVVARLKEYETFLDNFVEVYPKFPTQSEQTGI